MPEVLSPPEHEQRRNDYLETVHILADSVIEELAASYFTTPDEVTAALYELVNNSAYVALADYAIDVLRYSQYPTRAFRGGPTDEAYNGSGPADDWDDGRRPFPWAQLARSAMLADCGDLIFASAAWQQHFTPIPVQPTQGDSSNEQTSHHE